MVLRFLEMALQSSLPESLVPPPFMSFGIRSSLLCTLLLLSETHSPTTLWNRDLFSEQKQFSLLFLTPRPLEFGRHCERQHGEVAEVSQSLIYNMAERFETKQPGHVADNFYVVVEGIFFLVQFKRPKLLFRIRLRC